MKNGLILLILIAGGFFITNPEKPSYVDYASVQFADAATDALCRSPQIPVWALSIASSVQGLCRGAITTGTTLGKEPIQNFISNSTERQNFFLLSLYTTQFPGRTIKTIGVLGSFFPIQ